TDGMHCFLGSDEAKKLLAAQGFVVTSAQFWQIFEPYLRSPLAVFVTPDSAWPTYHIVFEQGVKETECTQSERLAAFSRLLLEAARAQATNGSSEFSALADFASIGLAFQDAAQREALNPRQKQFIQALLTGTSEVEFPIGFPLSPVHFRPQSFYTESAELKDFYRAHQWYACVD